MARKIQHKRGLEANLPQLDEAEIAFTTDSKKPFIGSADGNVEIAKKADVDEKASKTELTNAVSPKADKTYVDTELGKKASTDEVSAVSAQLADTETNVEDVTKSPNYYNGAIVTIIDDDCKNEFKTVWQPVLNDTGAKITLAAISGWVGTDGYMTLEELKDLQAQGHEIVSHTVNHQTTADITVESAETEYPQSQKWLKDNGFTGYNTLVYPGGMHTNRIEIKNVARKYYKYAVATNIGGSYNTTPVDNWRVPRIEGDVSTLEQLKTAVDQAVQNNGWVILMTHSHVVDSQKMRDFITYVQGLDVPIMTFGEASRYKGNAVAIGEYTDEASTFVSVTGASKLGSGLIVGKGQYEELNRPITDYPQNAKTIRVLTAAADTFQNKGGVYEVFRPAESDFYAYATFRTWDSNKIYQRKWNYTNKAWAAWEDIAKQTYDTGFWTPKLEGTTTAGAHTYTVQSGSYTRVANMAIARFSIRINVGSLDASMAGNLNITGLPFTAVAHTANNSYGKIEYNILNLGTNFTEVIGKAYDTYIQLLKQGNGVITNFVKATDIPSDQVVVLKGQVMYQIP